MSSSRLTHIIITVALLILPFCTKAQNEELHMPLQDTAHLKANEVLTHADSVTLATDSVVMTKKKKRDWDTWNNDPTTESYNQFMHLGAKITKDNISRYQTLFKNRKDRYRRWRDMSFFVLVGVYALSVIDAYVDASLSEFDISKDLSLRVEPAVVNTNNHRNPLQSGGIGVHCSLNF